MTLEPCRNKHIKWLAVRLRQKVAECPLEATAAAAHVVLQALVVKAFQQANGAGRALGAQAHRRLNPGLLEAMHGETGSSGADMRAVRTTHCSGQSRRVAFVTFSGARLLKLKARRSFTQQGLLRGLQPAKPFGPVRWIKKLPTEVAIGKRRTAIGRRSLAQRTDLSFVFNLRLTFGDLDQHGPTWEKSKGRLWTTEKIDKPGRHLYHALNRALIVPLAQQARNKPLTLR